MSATLWPDSTDAKPNDNLRTCLKDLRRVLGQGAPRLSPRPRTLAFDAAGTECDLLAFDAAIARGDVASLEQALALYGGEFLEGCDAEWIFLERETRTQAYLSALGNAIAERSGRGVALSGRCTTCGASSWPTPTGERLSPVNDRPLGR